MIYLSNSDTKKLSKKNKNLEYKYKIQKFPSLEFGHLTAALRTKENYNVS